MGLSFPRLGRSQVRGKVGPVTGKPFPAKGERIGNIMSKSLKQSKTGLTGVTLEAVGLRTQKAPSDGTLLTTLPRLSRTWEGRSRHWEAVCRETTAN